MKSFQLRLVARISIKQLSIIFILISAASITGPFISFNNKDSTSSSKYYGTQIIRHPVELTKDIIKDTSYVIVIDGGSTGTRLHVFSFVINQDVKQRRISLDKEDFFHTSPGLSSYSDNITKAAHSLDPLLQKAINIVPTLLVKETPIILKATAGLRLLSEEIASNILDSVEQRLKLLPFKVQYGAVSMLNEEDEGVFAWYTVNFLLDKLHKINESIATLDLGGGSTQITFSTNNLNTLIKSSSYIVEKNIEGQLEFIYTHSYLGNGLMAARKSILLQQDNSIISSNSIEDIVIKNPCFKMLKNSTYYWKLNPKESFHISHDESYDNPWEECLIRAEKFIEASQIDKPEELVHRKIYAMSYFYDRMKDIKVVKHESGQIKVKDYFIYSENICNGAIKMKNQSPFLCLDLTYIAAYLHYGLGIPLSKDIMLVKKIKNIETSWALGAAINMFDP